MTTIRLFFVLIASFAAGSTPALAERPVTQPRSASADAGDTGGATLRVPVPEPSERAMERYRSGNLLWVVSQLVALAIPAMLLFTGFSARMRSLAGRIGRRWFFIVAVYFILYSLLAYVLEWPLAYYAGFVWQHAYGLSNQTFARWFAESLKGLAFATLFGCLILWIPYLLIRRSPRRWWLYGGLLALPLMIFVTMIEPIWVAPLFNRFGPMKDRQLESRILALAQRAGIEGSRVFEVDKSADTKTVNAYMTGVFGTKRIVLWDTLLAKLDDDQVLAVMAHEMGHYVLNHIAMGILVATLGAVVGLYLVYRLSNVFLRRAKGRFGFDRLDDVASLPLLMLVLQLVSLVLMPLGLAYSRHIERQADQFALELTHDNHAAATSFVRLQEANLSNPRPGLLFTLWRGSHPSLAERIEFANDYRPWERGEPLQYGHLFAPKAK
ncbi:MAG: M48 family metallopeptidase [Thermoguttaceae bacterium]